jgi:hypothetical protein
MHYETPNNNMQGTQKHLITKMKHPNITEKINASNIVQRWKEKRGGNK